MKDRIDDMIDGLYELVGDVPYDRVVSALRALIRLRG